MKCPKCESRLIAEGELQQYPLLCKECDENFFIFEAIEEYDGGRGDAYEQLHK